MNILIIGAGIAGLSTAISLKLQGFNVKIAEKNSSITDIGAGIISWPNASNILDKLGLLEEVLKVSGKVTSMNRFTSEGENLGTIDITTLNEMMSYPSLSILRCDLMRILNNKINEMKISIHFNHNLLSFVNNNNLVSEKFTNKKIIKADVIIGADGRMNSLTREYVKGDNTPKYQGFINWVGIIKSKNDIFTNLSVSDYWGIGKRFGIVPISKNQAYWAGGMTSKNIETKNPSLYKNELLHEFKDWPSNVLNIIKNTKDSGINKIYVHDHDPLSTWHKNNVILIGDCAHAALPTSGQGACQALEDAWHLASCLKENSNNLTHAFESFTKIRIKKTNNITMGGRALAFSIFNDDKEFCLKRNIHSQNTNGHKQASAMANLWLENLA